MDFNGTQLLSLEPELYVSHDANHSGKGFDVYDFNEATKLPLLDITTEQLITATWDASKQLFKFTITAHTKPAKSVPVVRHLIDCA